MAPPAAVAAPPAVNAPASTAPPTVNEIFPELDVPAVVMLFTTMLLVLPPPAVIVTTPPLEAEEASIFPKAVMLPAAWTIRLLPFVTMPEPPFLAHPIRLTLLAWF